MLSKCGYSFLVKTIEKQLMNLICKVALLFSLTFSGASLADTSVDLSSIKNQFDNSFNHTKSMEYIIYAADMETKDVLQDALSTINTDCMNDGKVVYLANISGMPKLIAKLFALPKMRKYPYPVWLDRNGSASKDLPSQSGAVGLIDIENSAISAATFFKDAKALSSRLTQICGSAVATEN